MTTHTITHHVTRIHTLDLGQSAHLAVHVTRYRNNGKREAHSSITAYVGKWNGKLDLNMGIDNQWALIQLHNWRSRGLNVSTFTIKGESHEFSI